VSGHRLEGKHDLHRLGSVEVYRHVRDHPGSTGDARRRTIAAPLTGAMAMAMARM
jgi:hypothetical protein